MGLAGLAALGNRFRVTYRTPLTGCAHDPGTGGAAGVARWAARVGVPVRMLEVPVWEASRALDEPEGNCVVTMGNDAWSPTGQVLSPTDWAVAEDWLARGNTLIVVTTRPQELPRVLREDLFPWAGGGSGTEPELFPFVESVDNRAETVEVPVQGGGSLTVDAKGPRWKDEAAPQPTAGKTGSPPTKPAPPPKPAAPSDPKRRPSKWQLAGDAGGGVLFRVPVGRGSVYVLLDELAWTNAGLDRDGNARALADILDRSVRGGTLAFDEYRHGHGRPESFLVYLMGLPGASAVLWLSAAWALLYAYGRNVRLKPVEPYVERERRTAQEAIDAVAQIYERARAAPLVVEAVARRLRQVARSPAEPPPMVVEVLEEADRYTRSEDRPARPAAAIRLVQQLIQLRKRIYGTRTVS